MNYHLDKNDELLVLVLSTKKRARVIRISHQPGHRECHPLTLLMPGRVSAHCSVVTVSRARPAHQRALCGITRVQTGDAPQVLAVSWPAPPGLKMGRRDGVRGARESY